MARKRRRGSKRRKSSRKGLGRAVTRKQLDQALSRFAKRIIKAKKR